MSTQCLDLNLPALLARTPLFTGLTASEIERIASKTREIALDRGKVLFNRGEPSAGFFLVIYGQIKLAFVAPNGSEKVVELIGPGQTFGEAVMFLDKPYPVTATALADVQLLHIGRDALFAELDHDPQLARKMLAGLSMKLHHLLADMEAYTLQSAKQRVVGYLLAALEGNTEPVIELSTSKGTIASRLSVTQEHFSRLIHELEQAGFIAISGRSIEVLNRAGLTQLLSA